MKFTGYIEGYYGKLFSWEERKEIVSSCAELRLNSYLYAPKEDYYHRVGWRETPPQEYQDNLKNFIEESYNEGVTVIPAIAPGLSYEFTSQNDKQILIERITQFKELGAQSVALLMDDIPLTLTEASAKKYDSLADAQLLLLAELQKVFDIELIFCPTVYTNQLLDCDDASTYLEKLASNLPDDIFLFWTGEHTIAETIDQYGCGKIASLYPGRIIFWDNYYSNDYCPTRLFVGPYEGRERDFIAEKSAGIMINPTGLLQTDKLLLDLYAHWLHGHNIDNTNWISIANKHGIPVKLDKLLPWFYGPYRPAQAKTLLLISREPIEFFTEYIVDWHSEMKREWYPYLHNLFTEIKFLTGKTITGKEWYDLRFPPAHAEKLYRG